MKIADLVTQMQVVLPQITDLFTTNVSIVSITPAGTTATATTSGVHGLVPSNAVAVSGSLAPVGITSITRVDDVATVVTATDHDITTAKPGFDFFNEEATLSGANEAEFNGTFTLLSAVNRRTFTFQIADSGPTSATGTMLLDDPGNPFGYNGLFAVVSVPTTTSFTYTLPQALTIAAKGTMLAHSSVRVTGAATVERALEMYTKRVTTDDLWAFVVLDDGVVSKDRTSRNDGISSSAPGSDRRQQFIQSVSVFVFTKAVDDLSGAISRDQMVDVRRFLLKTLVGVKFDSDLAAQEGTGLLYLGDGTEIYDGARYVHRFDFQLLTSITENDTVGPGINVAFRDVNISMLTSLGTEALLADVSLDDEPLP